MGNCLGHKSSRIVDARHEDDLYFKPSRSFSVDDRFLVEDKSKAPCSEDRSLVEDESKVPCSSAVVKIKITKKQLEELLGRVQVKGVSMEQILSQLLNVSKEFHTRKQQTWRPVLQTIP
ncbi:hypothetical protein ACHQM5_003561 [Ranunculus cassubicifolius]